MIQFYLKAEAESARAMNLYIHFSPSAVVNLVLWGRGAYVNDCVCVCA